MLIFIKVGNAHEKSFVFVKHHTKERFCSHLQWAVVIVFELKIQSRHIQHKLNINNIK